MSLIEIIWVPWIICIGLLGASQFTGNKSFALWGDIMLAVSFGLSSAILLHARSYWIGGAFALPAIRQVYVLLVPRLRGPQNHETFRYWEAAMLLIGLR